MQVFADTKEGFVFPCVLSKIPLDVLSHKRRRRMSLLCLSVSVLSVRSYLGWEKPEIKNTKPPTFFRATQSSKYFRATQSAKFFVARSSAKFFASEVISCDYAVLQ